MTPAVEAAVAAGLQHRVVDYGPVSGIAEAAAKRGVAIHKVIKSLVVRRRVGDYLMVLVPGDRVIDWSKLRSHLDVSRISLASEEEAYDVTGYRRGAITPLGSTTAIPVVVDASLSGEISLGGGAHGISIHVDADELCAHLGAAVADVTKPGG